MDIIERLRLGNGTSPDHELLLEAAHTIESLRQQLAEAQKSPWISVEDRLPELNTIVLVLDQSFIKQDQHMMEYGNYREPGVRFGIRFASGDFRVEGCNGKCFITHWMPLPAAPMRKEAK